MKLNHKIFLLAFMAMPASLWAQESTTMSLSLAEAQQYAIEHNRSLQNASIEVKKAEAARWQTIAGLLPQADATLNLQNTNGNMKIGLAEGQPPMERTIKNTTGSLGVSASIAINGQMIMGALLNTLAIDMQNINLQKSALTLRMDVMQIYLSILTMENIADLLQKSLENVQGLKEMTQKAVDVGVQEQTAADQIAVKVNTLNNNINSTRRNIEIYYNSMRVLLGLGADTELRLTQSLDELLNAETALQLLETDFSIDQNLDYQLLQKNTEVAKKNVTMAGLAYLPTLSAFYQYSSPNKYFMGEAAMEQQMGVVGMALSVPLWSSGKRAAAVTEKKLAYKAAQNTLDETTDNLYIQNRQLRFNLNNAYETYTNEKDNIDVTQRVFESTSNKFTHGVASSLELINASNDLISAQNSYVQAVLTLVNAQIELHKFLNRE